MSAKSTTMIKNMCDKFCRIRGIKDPAQKDRLLKLAIRSYHAMPAKDRPNWTLEEIMKQGL